MDTEIILYCVRCRADFKGQNAEKFFPKTCPSCHRDTHWTATSSEDDNDDYWKDEKHEPANKYFSKKNFISKRLGDELLRGLHFITFKDTGEIYVYRDGIYRSYGESLIKVECQKKLGEKTTTHRVQEVIEYIKRETFIDRDTIDSGNDSLCLENGIFSLTTKKLNSHTPEKIFLNQLPVCYKPKAECPKINQFISEIVYPEDILVLQEITGYCLLCDYPIQKAIMLLGEGANGKSTFLQLLTQFLGRENIGSVPLQELEHNRFASASLYGKLVNIYADLADKALSHTGTFKMLTGGDQVSAEKKFKDKFHFRNKAKLIFSCNRLPLSRDDTPAFYRRWVLINFPHKFEGETADPFKLKKIATKKELSGMFNWALNGLRRLLKNGEFSNTKTTEELRQKYIALSNSTLAFIEECLQANPEERVPKNDLYQTYCEFCKKKNLPIKSQNSFTRELPRHLRIMEERPRIQGQRVRCWKGIELSENGLKYLPTLSPMSKISSNLSIENYYSNDTKSNNKDGQEGQDGQSPIISKCIKVMIRNPTKKWSIGELADETGFSSIQIKDALYPIVSSPTNSTPLRITDEMGDFYILDKKKLEQCGGIKV